MQIQGRFYMKHKKLLVGLLSLACVATSTFAISSCDNTDKGTSGLYYERIEGKNEYCLVGIGEALETDIVIPATYKRLPVTTIGNDAFRNCDNLTSVEIGDSVTTIGHHAFTNCTSLTSVEIGDSVTTIGLSAFNGCDKLVEVVIPDGVTSIGFSAFSHCDSLTSVVIGDSVTSIGPGAFEDCYSLMSVVIGDSVTEIDSNAFGKCYKLVEVVNNSPYITVEQGSTSNGCIGFYALGVYNSGDTFTGTKISNDNGYIVYTDDIIYKGKDEKILIGYTGDETELVLPSNITIIYAAFFNCGSLVNVVIPDSVTMIASYSFQNCTSLKSVVIPDNVTWIGYCAFTRCDLTSVYYTGTAEDWAEISIDSSNYSSNYSLTNATK